jgi:hypothetical protein
MGFSMTMIKKPSITDLEKGLLIDKDALDEAIENQPDLFYHVSQELAYLISERDAAKQAVENTESEADVSIRQLVKKSTDKVTESEIKARINNHKKVRDATDDYLNLCRKVGQYTALKEAFQQRGYALNKLVDLYTAGYFGDAAHRTSMNSMKDHNAQTVRRRMNQKRNENG